MANKLFVNYMKNILSLLVLLQFSTVLSAQIVQTFAGIVDSIGSSDGIETATFNNPHGIAVGPSGAVYICDRFNHTIRKISLNGQVLTLAGQVGISGDVDGQGASARFHEPWSICVDPNENVFVTDTRNNKIRKITPDGMVSTFAGTGNFGTSDGPTDNSTFGQPVGIETDGNGNFYIADHGTHIIRKIGNDGQVSTLAGAAYETGDLDGPGPEARFNKPYGLTIDLDGNIILADEWNHKIRKITPDGMVSTIAGIGTPGGDNGANTTASFNFPWDVAVDANGAIFVADGINFAIRKIDNNGNEGTTTYAGKIGISGHQDGIGEEARFSGATGVVFSNLTKELYVADAFNQTIRKITDPQQGIILTTFENTTSYCPAESIQLNAFPNAFDQYQFIVDEEVLAISENSNYTFTGLTPGNHTIQVIGELNGMEITSEAFQIEVFEVVPPTIETIGSTTFFEGDSVILISSFGAEYFWSSGEDTPTLTVMEAGSYTVEVTDLNNCSSTSTPVEVTVQFDPEAIFIAAESTTDVCEGEILLITANQTNNLQWLKDGWPISGATEISLSVVEPGNYQAQYEDINGIVVMSNSLEVNFLPALELDFGVNKNTVRQNEEVEFSILSPDLINVEWDFGDGNKMSSTASSLTYQYADIGYYDVQLIGVDNSGCTDTLIKSNLVRVFSESLSKPKDDVFIATAFTPNGDGNNDRLMIRGTDMQSIHFKVFTDCGNLVFESNSQNQGWDGTIDNRKAPSGNYLYQLNYKDLQGVEKVVVGKTALLK